MKRAESSPFSGMPDHVSKSFSRFMKGEVPPVVVNMRRISKQLGIPSEEDGIVASIGIRVDRKVEGKWMALIFSVVPAEVRMFDPSMHPAMPVLAPVELDELSHPPAESRSELLLQNVLVPCDCGAKNCSGGAPGVVHMIRQLADGKWIATCHILSITGSVYADDIPVGELVKVEMPGAKK